ncbi:hypothetical protein K458DRAFT_385907 [Lentithecium fluviatile CBS 122367]|uniref:Uncharacterized protein n=1 Tax=Lentithecium fluviatile CBS 122367 TaxID=1168545 RepID=A0A6G1J948_9PLEO|nr:hypothetical protein K458DRAFT_385907 [Lentithecium fluviatile CBS 122367]
MKPDTNIKAGLTNESRSELSVVRPDATGSDQTNLTSATEAGRKYDYLPEKYRYKKDERSPFCAYDLLYAEDAFYWCRFGVATEILRTCKQVYAEAISVLYLNDLCIDLHPGAPILTNDAKLIPTFTPTGSGSTDSDLSDGGAAEHDHTKDFKVAIPRESVLKRSFFEPLWGPVPETVKEFKAAVGDDVPFLRPCFTCKWGIEGSSMAICRRYCTYATCSVVQRELVKVKEHRGLQVEQHLREIAEAKGVEDGSEDKNSAKGAEEREERERKCPGRSAF